MTVVTRSKTVKDGPLNFEFNPDDMKNVKIFELKAWPFRIKRPAPEKWVHAKKIPLLTNLRRYMEAFWVIRFKDFWGFPVIKKLSRLRKIFPYEIVVSTYGPPGGHIIASYLKKKFNVFWVADYRDLWHGNHYRHQKWPFNFMEDKSERIFVKKADLITTVSKGLNKKLSKRFNCEVIIIENGFDEDDFPDTTENEKIFPDDGKFRIAYTGRIYKGGQDPSPLFEALVLLSKKGFPVEKKIEVLFYGSSLDNLEKLINRYRLEGVVKMPGFVSRKESLNVQKSVDALLFLQWEDPSTDGILTGKLFEYIFSGRPVLSIGGVSNTEPANLIEASGTGVCLGKSPQFIADTLEKMVNGYKIVEGSSKEKLARYSRKYLAEKMLDLITEKRFAGAGKSIIMESEQTICSGLPELVPERFPAD